MAQRGYEHIKDRVGKCYLLAANYVTNHQGFKLVHGRLRSPYDWTEHQLLDHAWAESRNKVFEPTTDKFYTKTKFNERFAPERHSSYTRRQAMNQMHEHEHYGPWH